MRKARDDLVEDAWSDCKNDEAAVQFMPTTLANVGLISLQKDCINRFLPESIVKYQFLVT